MASALSFLHGHAFLLIGVISNVQGRAMIDPPFASGFSGFGQSHSEDSPCICDICMPPGRQSQVSRPKIRYPPPDALILKSKSTTISLHWLPVDGPKSYHIHVYAHDDRKDTLQTGTWMDMLLDCSTLKASVTMRQIDISQIRTPAMVTVFLKAIDYNNVPGPSEMLFLYVRQSKSEDARGPPSPWRLPTGPFRWTTPDEFEMMGWQNPNLKKKAKKTKKRH